MEKREERVALLKREARDNVEEELGLAKRIWVESKELWRIVGPEIFSRVVAYSMNVITQAFAGHLGDLELASMSIANTVVVGFNFGLMGIWVGMIGGTAVQTLILAILTICCDWEKEAMIASTRMEKWATVE